VGVPLRNPRHEVFCQYYVLGHPSVNGAPATWREKSRRNATRSYEAAGYTSKGNVATVAAARLLRRPDIQGRIKALERERRRSDGNDG
jgi:hypothetical protein